MEIQLIECFRLTSFSCISEWYFNDRIFYINPLEYNEIVWKSFYFSVKDNLTSTYDYIAPVLKELRWLPVKFWIEYKIILTTYKCFNERAPSYLQELVNLYSPTRSLRSALIQVLPQDYAIPSTKLQLKASSVSDQDCGAPFLTVSDTLIYYMK